MTNYVTINDGVDFGTKAGKLAAVMQGEVGPPYLIDVQDLAGNDFDITNATNLEGRLENPKTEVVTDITGTLAVSGGGISWTRAAEDIGTAGNFSAVFEFTLSAKQYKTFPASLAVIADPAATAVGGVALVGIPETDADWLTAEKAATEAAADGEILRSDGTNSEGSGYLAATSLRKNNFTAVTAPGVGDDTGDGYAAGSYWVDTVGGAIYFCQDATLGEAEWIDLTAATTDLATHEALTTAAHGGVLPEDAAPATVASSRDITTADRGKILEVTATANLNFPNGLAGNLQCAITSIGGTTTITAATTLLYLDGGAQTAASGLTVNAQCTVYHRGSNVYLALGDVTPI